MELRDLQSFAGKPLSDFTLIVFDETVFFHYLPYNEGNGFEFICFQQDDVNHDEIEMIVNGYACFDGIRHLYFGDEKSDNYGYFNYPKIPVLVDIMNLLNKLEKEHCIR